jgi:hypothetical protein
MRSTTVVFRGRKQVVDAYMLNDMPCWAIASGKVIMFADDEADSVDDGAATLDGTLAKLVQGGSRAQFELRVYEDLKKGEKIMNNTPFPRGFNFVLYDNEAGEFDPFQNGRVSYAREADEKIEKLNAEIQVLKMRLDEDGEEEPEPPKLTGVEGMIAGILKMPGVQQALQAKLVGLIHKIIPMNTGAEPSAVAGVPDQQGAGVSILQPGQPEKLQQAVDILCTRDELLGDHLLAIAKIAVSDPNQYKFLIGMLK